MTPVPFTIWRQSQERLQVTHAELLSWVQSTYRTKRELINWPLSQAPKFWGRGSCYTTINNPNNVFLLNQEWSWNLKMLALPISNLLPVKENKQHVHVTHQQLNDVSVVVPVHAGKSCNTQTNRWGLIKDREVGVQLYLLQSEVLTVFRYDQPDPQAAEITCHLPP